MMSNDVTTIAGLEIPSTDPLFLSVVAFHVVVGLVCVVAGALAMVSPKAAGRHPRFGTIYFWSLSIMFVTASLLSLMRWTQDYHLFALGALAVAAASLGRAARRGVWPGGLRLHIVAMGSSYILLLTAFYVDNGRSLPLWKELPAWTYWTLPAAVGAPIIIWVLFRHPLARR